MNGNMKLTSNKFPSSFTTETISTLFLVSEGPKSL